MRQLIDKALQGEVWVVVGATDNPQKFGNKIFRRLKNAGYRTYPLNPFHREIQGDCCYGTPAELPEVPDCVNMVVGPEKGRTQLKPLYERGARLLWFQPGSYDSALLDEAAAMGFEVIHGSCVLIELGQIGK